MGPEPVTGLQRGKVLWAATHVVGQTHIVYAHHCRLAISRSKLKAQYFTETRDQEMQELGLNKSLANPKCMFLYIKCRSSAFRHSSKGYIPINIEGARKALGGRAQA